MNDIKVWRGAFLAFKKYFVLFDKWRYYCRDSEGIIPRIYIQGQQQTYMDLSTPVFTAVDKVVYALVIFEMAPDTDFDYIALYVFLWLCLYMTE